ncbi:MAG: hypothetical protein ACLTSX_00250 [Collinsella sp.]
MYTRKGEKDKAYRTTTMPTDVDLTEPHRGGRCRASRSPSPSRIPVCGPT